LGLLDFILITVLRLIFVVLGSGVWSDTLGREFISGMK
jgi:hypothetical protein